MVIAYTENMRKAFQTEMRILPGYSSVRGGSGISKERRD